MNTKLGLIITGVIMGFLAFTASLMVFNYVWAQFLVDNLQTSKDLGPMAVMAILLYVSVSFFIGGYTAHTISEYHFTSLIVALIWSFFTQLPFSSGLASFLIFAITFMFGGAASFTGSMCALYRKRSRQTT